jgi:hypothetical protein
MVFLARFHPITLQIKIVIVATLKQRGAGARVLLTLQATGYMTNMNVPTVNFELLSSVVNTNFALLIIVKDQCGMSLHCFKI